MNKLAKLFNRIEKFSIDAQFEYKMVKLAASVQDILSKSEEFDIKDEDLFNQFEAFMSGYKELMDTLKVDSANLDPDSFEDAGELLTTLQSRLERIIKNPYFNMSEDEGWDEDFDPGDLIQFIVDVYKDAEAKLKSFAGEDFEISDMKAAQLAKEFNQQGIDKGDKNITWTGDKVQQSLEAKKKHHEQLMFYKKINHPAYQAYIESRHRIYKDIMNDPERKNLYREKARQRQAKFSKKLDERKKEILALLQKETRVSVVNELEKELLDIESKIKARQDKGRHIAQQIRKKKEENSLSGLVVHLQQRLASFKKDAAVSVKNKASKDPFFNSFKMEIKSAKDNFDADPSPSNKQALEASIKKEMDALQTYLNDHPITKNVLNDLPVMYSFRDNLKTALKQGWLEESVPKEVKPFIQTLAEEGTNLVNNFDNSYPGPIKIVKEIVSMLQGKL